MIGTPGRERGFWVDLCVLAGALEALAVAVWLIPASVYIVRWSEGGPVRVALFAPTRTLLLLAATGLLVVGALAVVGRRSSAPARAASVLGPLVVLWLWSLPYLPWLPDRLPLLLVLAGPVRWIVAAAVALAVARRIGPLAWLPALVRSVDRRWIFGVGLTVYLMFGLYAVGTNGLGGDEPHYLVITESLLKDRDLKIENNHAQGDYRAFFRGNLRPDYIERGKDGQIYSIHAPGLPVLLLPAYALAGYLGAVAMVCLLAALTGLAVFDLAKKVAGGDAAPIAWAAVCLTVPFVPLGWQVFPEMPGALGAAWAALWLWQPTNVGVLPWIGRGAALGVLPWLHTKFSVLLAVFTAGLALRLVRQPRALIAFLTPVIVSLTLWALYFYLLYGIVNPEAPYGTYSQTNVLIRNIPHGLLGLFLDQKFGLLFYSPIYLAALAGTWLMLKRQETRYLGAVLLLAAGAFVGSTARLYMFWGGSSAPARLLVPVLPCLAPMIAVAVAAATRPAARALLGLWLVISLAVAAAGIGWPSRSMLFSDPHGRARVLEALQASSPLALTVPTFTDPDWASQIGQLWPWLFAAAIGLGALAVAASRRWILDVWRLAGAAVAVCGLAAAVFVARPSAAVREATARRGATELLWHLGETRGPALGYATLGRETWAGLQRLMTLELRLQPESPARGSHATPQIALPPGSYEAIVSFVSERRREGQVEVAAASSQVVFGRVSGPLPNPARVRFELPVAARRVVVRVADAETGSAVSRVEVVPLEVVPPKQRETSAVRAIESLSGPTPGEVVYTDEHAYPEGGVFWTRGTEETRILVAPHRAARIVLTLFSGPNSGNVIVSGDGQVRTIGLLAGTAREIGIDVPRGQRLVPLAIQSQMAFRPAEVDKASSDMRWLGCQVRVRLE